MDENGGAQQGAVAAAIAAARGALDGLAGVGPWQASDVEVAELVVTTEMLSRRLAGVQLAAIAEGVSRGLPYASGAGSAPTAPGRWVRSLIAVNPHEAKRRAALASDLFTQPGAPEFAPTRAALRAGAISTAHAQVVVTTIEKLLPPSTPAGVVDETTRAEAQALLAGAAAG